MQDLPSTREATERAETVGGIETATGVEAESCSTPTAESNQRSSDISDEDRDKRLSHSDSDICPSTGKFVGLCLMHAVFCWVLLERIL